VYEFDLSDSMGANGICSGETGRCATKSPIGAGGRRVGAMPKRYAASSNAAMVRIESSVSIVSNPKVSYEAILEPHCQRTQQSCREPWDYLFLEDSTDLSFFTHRHTQGLGRLGEDSGYGLKLNTSLAVRVDAWARRLGPHCSTV